MLNFFKKKENTRRFPEMPSSNNSFPQFPTQKIDLQMEDKEAVSFPTFPELKDTFIEKPEEFPTYKPAFPSQEHIKLNIPEEKPLIHPKEELEIPIRKPIFKPTIAENIEEKPIFKPKELTRPTNKEDSIFVKVEKYEEARSIIEDIQERLEETQRLIEDLAKTKEDEELQLKSYQETVNSIKLKLIEIERTLFSE